MKADIITIGDEILIGQTVDTNSAWMAEILNDHGIEVRQITSVSDTRQHIIRQLERSMAESPLVLLTGGLGPTSDDITKKTLAEFFDCGLAEREEVLDFIRFFLAKRALLLNENNRRQAEVPTAATVLPNRLGTAPGLWFESKGCIVVSMPGVPYEMKDLMEKEVLPRIDTASIKTGLVHKSVMTYGTFEAHLAERLSGFEKQLPSSVSLAYLPGSGVIKLRLTGKGEELRILRQKIREQVSLLYELIPEYIYGEDDVQLEQVTGSLLLQQGRTVSTAESCTGGNIARKITAVSGSSTYYKGTIVAYANEIKTGMLGVHPGLLQKEGAVSGPVAEEMAAGVRRIMGTDIGMATTGIAGPSGGSPQKPVGTVWIALASADAVTSRMFSFGRIREHNIHRGSLAALNMLRMSLLEKTERNFPGKKK